MNFPEDKILMVTAGHVGNTLFCTPAIHLLKKHKPNLQIDVVTFHERASDALVNNPDIHKIILNKRRWKLRRLIKSYPLTLFLNHDSFELCYPDKQSPSTVISIHPSKTDKHRAEEVLEFMQKLLACKLQPEDHYYVLKSFEKDVNKITSLLDKKANDIFIGIHLGSGRTQIHGWKFWYKRRTFDARLWPVENYITLASKLQKQNPNIRFVITGGDNERFLGKEFMKKIPNTLNFIGKTTISELATIIDNMSVFITHDTGVLHVANARQVPLVALFARTDSNRSGPYPLKSHHKVIQRNLMADIQPEEVCQTVLTFVTEGRFEKSANI